MSYKRMHPGVYLRHAIMEPLDMRVSAMAKILALPESGVYQLLSGWRAVDQALAERLGAFFDMTPSFWMDMQRDYEKALREQRLHDRVSVAKLSIVADNPPASGSQPPQQSGAILLRESA